MRSARGGYSVDKGVPVKAFTQTQGAKDAFLKNLYKSMDWRFVMDKLRKKYKVIVQDDVAYINGDLVAHEGEIACQLNIDVKIRLSVICDKSGNCLKLKAARYGGKEERNVSGKEESLLEKTNNARRQEMAKMATGLAEMIADINQSNIL